jgi:hypothetical protein
LSSCFAVPAAAAVLVAMLNRCRLPRQEAAKARVPLELVQEVQRLGRLPVVNFAAGGVATPADAAMMMQLGCDGVFVGSGIFKSDNPGKRASAIVQAVTHYNDPSVGLAPPVACLWPAVWHTVAPAKAQRSALPRSLPRCPRTWAGPWWVSTATKFTATPSSSSPRFRSEPATLPHTGGYPLRSLVARLRRQRHVEQEQRRMPAAQPPVPWMPCHSHRSLFPGAPEAPQLSLEARTWVPARTSARRCRAALLDGSGVPRQLQRCLLQNQTEHAPLPPSSLPLPSRGSPLCNG